MWRERLIVISPLKNFYIKKKEEKEKLKDWTLMSVNGRLAEWLIALVLKTNKDKTFQGSNP